MTLVSVKSTFTLLFWHKILIPNIYFKRYCHKGLCMSQHTGSHKNNLNLLGEKYLNESHWPMHRIRLLECRAYFNELPSTFKMHSLFVKHHYFHLSPLKKLLSSCWLIQVYIQCKTISSCRHFRHQQNRNRNFVHHCIKTWQKMQKLIKCNSDSLILQCFQDIFIIYQFQIILWNGPECLKYGLK